MKNLLDMLEDEWVGPVASVLAIHPCLDISIQFPGLTSAPAEGPQEEQGFLRLS